MRNIRFFLPFILILLVMGQSSSATRAQVNTEKVFPTGITLRGVFLEFYESNPFAEIVYGYPQSPEIIRDNKIYQYFDRVRFELDLSELYPKPKLSKLGSMLEEGEAVPANIPTTSPTCRYFPKNGHFVCYNFSRYYNQFQGALYFGEPRTEAEYRGGRLVQYFDYARLEYRPNNPDGYKVGLTDLGIIALEKFEGLPATKVRAPDSAIPQKNLDLSFNAKAFVSRALVAPNTSNTIFVVAQTKSMAALPGATVNVSVVVGNEKPRLLAVATTDSDGVAKVIVPAMDLPASQVVELKIEVSYGEVTVLTSTWYRIWY